MTILPFIPCLSLVSAPPAPVARAEDEVRPGLVNFGLPEGSVTFQGRFCFAFDGRTRNPRWVYERLDRETVDVQGPRIDAWRSDYRIPAFFRVSAADYGIDTSLDKGHLAAAGNYGQPRDKAATFVYSNCIPQHERLNQGLWRYLEGKIAASAREPDVTVYVLTCPLYLPAQGSDRVSYRLIGPHSVAIPTHCGKATLTVHPSREPKCKAWIVPNDDPRGADLLAFEKTVDQLELASGLELFDGLSDDLEERLEAGK